VEEIIEKVLKNSRNHTEVSGVRIETAKSQFSKTYSRGIEKSCMCQLVIRVTLPDGRLGVASAIPSKWKDCLSNARKMAKLSAPDPDYKNLPPKQEYKKPIMNKERNVADFDDLKFIESIKLVKKTCKEMKTNLMESMISKVFFERNFSNSNGISSHETSAATNLGVWVSHRKNSTEQSATSRGVVDFEGITKESCELCLRGVGAKKLKTSKMSLILEYEALCSLLEATLIPSFSGFRKQRSMSCLSDKIGKEIASPGLSIYDDGLMANGIASSKFDREGVRRKNTVLVKNGILRNFLFDHYSALKEGKPSTGNCGSIYSRPNIMPSNFVIKPGNVPREEIISSTCEGILVHGLLGSGGSNDISGDFSPRVTDSFYIKDGSIIHPVKNVMIAGNIFEIIKQISMIGKKSIQRDFISAPLIKFEDIQVVG